MEQFEDLEQGRSFDLKKWKGLFPFLARYKKQFFTAMSFIIAISIVDIILPLFQRYAIDNFIEQGTTEGIWLFAAVYFVVITLQCLGVVVFTRRAMFIEMSVGRDLKRACFVHLQELSFNYYNATPVGYMMARTMSDTGRISGMLAWGLIDMMWSLVYVVGVFVAMFLLNWKLALIVLVVVPLLALLTAFFQGRLLVSNRRQRRINSMITTAYNEGITGVRTSKTLVIEKDNDKSFRSLSGKMLRETTRAARMSGVYIAGVIFCGYFAAAIVLGRGGMMVHENLMLLGTLSAFTSYAIGIFEPIQNLARLLAEFLSLQVNIERVRTLLDETPNVTDAPEVTEKYGDALFPKTENWEPIHGDIEFRNVSFKYPDGGDYVLKNFNLKVPQGMTVAIVGETGAGKSTLVNLACRFFEPTEGEILVDGVDYRKRSQLWLHSSIGYVLQNPHLFSGTVRENIRYGKLDATDAEIEAAAKSVSADTVVEKLEKGYDSEVGEGGDRLSTGEKQLVSFARAVIADPRIFVLDEATSSIDTHTEQLIQNAISTLLHARTSFIIAHRLSTIRQADLILVVQNGSVVEQGTHDELMAAGGHYAGLYNRQFEDEAAMRVLRAANA